MIKFGILYHLNVMNLNTSDVPKRQLLEHPTYLYEGSYGLYLGIEIMHDLIYLIALW